MSFVGDYSGSTLLCPESSALKRLFLKKGTVIVEPL